MRLKAGIVASFIIHFLLFFIFIHSKAPDLRVEIEPVSVNFVETMGHHAQTNTQVPKSFTARTKILSQEKNRSNSTLPSSPRHAPTSDEISTYIAQIVKLLQDHKVYPKSAIDREQEGDVVVSLDVSASGSITNLKLVMASPFESLNQAALQSVTQIGQFPHPPKGSPSSLSFAIPFHYRIEHH